MSDRARAQHRQPLNLGAQTNRSIIVVNSFEAEEGKTRGNWSWHKDGLVKKTELSQYSNPLRAGPSRSTSIRRTP